MQYLIWDFDGTLGYHDGGMWTGTLLKIVQEAMPELGVTRERIRPHLQTGYPWHTPEQPHLELNSADIWWEAINSLHIRAMVGAGVPAERARELVREFRPRYTDLSHWRLFPDVQPTLTTLATAGWRHILLTNHVPELPVIFTHLGLAPLFDAVFNSAQTGYEKPHPQAFRNVLDFIGTADAVWMIGDNPLADIAGAAALGIPGILVRKTHPDMRYCCAELAQVIDIVSNMIVSTGELAYLGMQLTQVYTTGSVHCFSRRSP